MVNTHTEIKNRRLYKMVIAFHMSAIVIRSTVQYRNINTTKNANK